MGIGFWSLIILRMDSQNAKEEYAKQVCLFLAELLRTHKIALPRAAEIAEKVTQNINLIDSEAQFLTLIKQLAQDFQELIHLGELVHMPVKKYSSGMLIRLGFSIATHLEAPILLIDEVLAVGDVGFQEKCLKKIRSLHQEGRTIVLVTHDPNAVRNHCNRCIVISDCQKVFDGKPDSGVDRYLEAVKTCP